MRKNILLAIALSTALVSMMSAQNENNDLVEITGSVKDHLGKPIKRAIIFVDSSETITKTNNKGIYKYKTKKNVQNIAVFSAKKGMLSKDLNGKIEADFIFPKEMQVVDKNDLASLGYNLRGDKSERYKKYDNIYELIATEFTGVTVRGTKVKVRGSATLTGSSAEPLYIVDGSYVRSLNTVIPTEIKSIEILKGQDASFYGVRGAHGVVIVELKKYTE